MLETGTQLGDLEKAHHPKLFTAQPGVYVAEGDRVVNKTRGFSIREVTFDALTKAYDEAGPFGTVRYSSRRFVGLGSAVHRKSMAPWRTWPETDRKLSLYPSRKTPEGYTSIDEWRAAPVQSVRHLPPRMDGMSDPYTPKTPDLLSVPGALDYLELQEQPDPGESYSVK
jgi:hypothetical protein